MLDRANLEALYSTLRKYISTLADHSIFYGKSEARAAIFDVVKDEAALFLFLAEKVGAEEEAKAVLDKFRQAFSVDSLEAGESVNYSSKKFEELRDDVNYLKVCVNNICGVDLDSEDSFVSEEVDVEAVNSPLEDYDSSKYQKIPDSLAVFKNALNEEINLDPSVGKELGEFILRSHAYERLNKDISDGSIYIYTSKPRKNVIVKYILLGLSTIGVFASLLLLLSLGKAIYDSNSALDEIS